jgi:AraC family transcriptional regulator of adaptative response/methylated-DNA-[protein]-cysteine methyltransferase
LGGGKSHLAGPFAVAPALSALTASGGVAARARHGRASFAHAKEIAMNAHVRPQMGAAEEIVYAFAASSLGCVLVAIAAEGVAAILIGDGRDALRRELATAFPQATLRLEEAGLSPVVAEVQAYLEAPTGEFGPKLALRGSALERAVWQALREIPAGRTATYGEIAKSLPLAATAQEVGAACAANRHAVVIPCHRVIKADGSISGYRWGVRRKRMLLAREAAG